jgi:hypothetical protein
MIETLRSENDVGVGTLLHLTTVLDEGESLHLFDGGGCTVLLSPVEWIIFLWHLKTEDGITNQYTDGNNSTENGDRT